MKARTPIDFKKQIEEGLHFGEERLAIKDSINDILNDFAKNLTDSLIPQNPSFRVYLKHEVIKETTSIRSILATANYGEPRIIDQYDALFLGSTKCSDKYVIFKYEIDSSSGYPCIIKYAGKNISCSNQDELVTCLGNMIKTQGLFVQECVRELNSLIQEKSQQ